jgi:hypothetical protein
MLLYNLESSNLINYLTMCVEAALVLQYIILSNSCCVECSGFSEPFILVQISFALLHPSEYAPSTMACH